MRMSLPERLLEQFLSNLRTNLQEKGFEVEVKLIRRHLHLYRFDDHQEGNGGLWIKQGLLGLCLV